MVAGLYSEISDRDMRALCEKRVRENERERERQTPALPFLR